MRERFDAGTGLVAIGAVVLLVSLFIDWYKPGGDAWAVFETLDLVLAGAAICGLLAVAPRFGTGGLGRALPIITVAALAVVIIQLLDPPPVVRHSDLATGAWLALAATALMAGGALLTATSISITVDVRGRERRRRAVAIDAREGAAEAAEMSEDPEPERPVRRFARHEGSLLTDRAQPRASHSAGTGEPPIDEPAEDPERTQALDPIEPEQQ